MIYFRKPVEKLPENPTPEEITNASDYQLLEFGARSLEGLDIIQKEQTRRAKEINRYVYAAEARNQIMAFDNLKVFKKCFLHLCGLFINSFYLLFVNFLS